MLFAEIKLLLDIDILSRPECRSILFGAILKAKYSVKHFQKNCKQQLTPLHDTSKIVTFEGFPGYVLKPTIKSISDLRC